MPVVLFALLLPLPALAESKPVPPELLAALKAKEPAARVKAIKALSRLGPEVVPPLVEALKDEEPDVSQSAAYALRLFKADAKVALAALAPHLTDKHAAVRKGVASALPRCGADAAPLLVARLADAEADVRRQAALSLQIVASRAPAAGKEALPGLEKALGDSSPAVRLAIVQALGRCGPGAVRPLLKGADDEDAKVRAYALAALLPIKPEAKTVLPVLSRLAKSDPEVSVRQSALRTLGSLGAPAVKAIGDALADPEPAVQLAALKSLAQVGLAGKSALLKVKGLAAKADNEKLRSGAVFVLSKFGPEGETAIVELLAVDNSTTRLACLQHLGRKGKVPRSAVPDLVKALADREADVRVLAAHVLGQMGADAKAAVPALTKARKDADANVVRVAEEALGKIAGE